MSLLLFLQLLCGGMVVLDLMTPADCRSLLPKTLICKLDNLPIANQILKDLSLKPRDKPLHNRPVYDIEVNSTRSLVLFYGNQSNELNASVWIISSDLRNSVKHCVAYINSTVEHPTNITGSWSVRHEREWVTEEHIKVECIPRHHEPHTSDAASVVQALAAVGIVIVLLILRILIRDKKPVNIYRISKNTTRVFDVFICYNSGGAGMAFACDVLYRKLKDEWELNVAIDNRNCIPGESKASSIQRCIEGSRKIVLVLTHDFLDNPWCKMETSSALCEMTKGSTTIVPIMFEDIRQSPDLEPELRHIIETKGFLKVPAPESKYRSRRFWTFLKRLLSPVEVTAPGATEADESIFILTDTEPAVLSGPPVDRMRGDILQCYSANP